jgi:catechol 2,3-dioxygenase-like lactoylglutathione lyase family enzyme
MPRSGLRVSNLASVSGSVAFNHLGHCVTDLARSRRFYEELLSFAVERELHPPDDPSSTLLRLTKPLGMTALYLRRDGLVLELLYFAGGTRPARERVMNEPGLTHISLGVDDVQGVCARVADYGGEVLPDTDIGFGIFIRDPDGQLIELLPMGYREQLDAGGT